MIRIIEYFSGLVLLAAGTIYSINSGLGIGATPSLGYVLSVVTGKSLGYFTVVLFSIYIITELCLCAAEERKLVILQLPVSILFSYLIDLISAAIPYRAATPLLLRLVYLTISIVITAFGSFFTVRAHFVPTAPDGAVSIIAARLKMPFGKVKIHFDSIHVACAVLLSLCCLKKLIGIGIGTVISSIYVGRLVNRISSCFKKHGFKSI
jgi:uncharacterized membrane protein YczE